MAYVYTLSNPISKEVRYIGKTCSPLTQRLNEHIYECKRSRRKSTNWVKSLLNKGLIPLIEVLDECTCEEVCNLETYWIYQFKCWGFNLTNHTTGGEGGYRIETPEEKERRREKFRGEKNPFYGRHHSEETKKKISEASRGRKMPLSHIESCKKRMENFKPSEKAISNMIARTKKAVVQLDISGNFIKLWDTINGCERETYFRAPKIIACCKGRNKTHQGYKWMYYSDYIEM